MTFSEIYRNIESGLYENKMTYPTDGKKPDNYIFDEDKTVRENRQLVDDWNNLVTKKKKDYNAESYRLSDLFTAHLKEAIKDDTALSNNAVEVIANKAYADGHSSGYYGIVQEAVDLCDFVSDVFKYNN